MLELDSPKWAELTHAYGAALDIPDLLHQLEGMPASDGEKEPWLSLWSSLAHQGDVYPASFAAVPHVVSILAKAPEKADFSFFQFPAWVEICRQNKSVIIPKELEDDYFLAIRQLPSLVSLAADRDWDDVLLLSALSAIAAAKGYAIVAEAILELTPAVAREFMEWVFTR